MEKLNSRLPELPKLLPLAMGLIPLVDKIIKNLTPGRDVIVTIIGIGVLCFGVSKFPDILSAIFSPRRK